MKNLHKNKKGFTLVESLVAISLVLVGVTAAFSAAQGGLSANSSVRNRITAAFLAQEAMEGVKNIKDTTLLAIAFDTSGSPPTWLSGVPQACINPSSNPNTACAYDIQNLGSVYNCTSQGCQVNLDLNGFYRQSNPAVVAPTGFVRRIRIEETVPGREASVTVTVTKETGNFPPYVLTSYMYNWF